MISVVACDGTAGAVQIIARMTTRIADSLARGPFILFASVVSMIGTLTYRTPAGAVVAISDAGASKSGGRVEAVREVDWLPDIGADARLQGLLVKRFRNPILDRLTRNRLGHGE